MTKRKRTITTLSQSKRRGTKGNEERVEIDRNNSCQFFLLKSEPESRLENGVDVRFSIQDLENEPEQSAIWDGVRNYQARNILKSMK
ncbi:Thymocyte nuclear protein 1 [Galdieria sulphuraria]|nr:Thymocyte nuclear protein 1 [Galdieria sulphuraria]